MKPELSAYKILYLEQTYFVLDPYDLYSMPFLKISGRGHRTRKEAEESLQVLFEAHVREYERLKQRGRGFPDND